MITWVDARAAPRCKPDPAYPEGVDLDVAGGAALTCSAPLPYPAAGIGRYEISCRLCGLSAWVSTAGRPDDPRSIRVACESLRRA